jgi:phosphatidylglycerol:prolipoprotein diacylglycerol transferase
MFPRIETPFGFPIHGYGLMIVTGFLIQLWVGGRETRRRGLPERFSDLALCFLLCGIVGGRLFYVIQYWEKDFAGRSPWSVFAIWEGGLVFYGGGIGGILGGLVFLIRNRLPVGEFMDIAAITGPIGMAFGRLGCFLNGCCYGRLCEADAALGVQFPPGSAAAARHFEHGLIAAGSDSLPVLPVQLYQAGHDILLFVGLWAIARWARPPRGSLMPLLIVLYGIGRHFIEGLRGDHVRVGSEWTVSQWFSFGLGVVFAGVVVVAWVLALLPSRPSRGSAGDPHGIPQEAS